MVKANSSEFLADLERALRSHKRLVAKIGPRLWDAARYTHEEASKKSGRPDLKAHDDLAQEIVRRARRLEKVLAHSERQVAQAISLNYLKGVFRPQDADGEMVSLGSLGTASLTWRAATNVRDALRPLIEEATAWEFEIKSGQRRGRKTDIARVRLGEYVAFQLHSVGIDLTKSKNGVFARVLAVVQTAAGFGARTGGDTERDVRRILGDPALLKYLRPHSDK